jgi:hypothetical protein
MTDEERKKLCENLRDRNNVAYQDCEDAADEIERLAAEVEELKYLMRGMEVPDR